jgi:transcriptional regulator with XRE-family HTH domain
MTFADEIRQALKKAGVSRYRIERDTGINRATLSRFVHGKAWLAEDTLNKLAVYLQLQVKREAESP